MLSGNMLRLSDEELIFILRAIGQESIPGLNQALLESNTDCNQKLLDMAGRVLVARKFIESDGNRIEIAKEILGIIYAAIYPAQMVNLTIQTPDALALHQNFYKVPEMLVAHTQALRIHYFEVDTTAMMTAEPIIRLIEETSMGNGSNGRQFKLTQQDIISLKQKIQLDADSMPQKQFDATEIDKLHNTLKNIQIQITLQLVYQLNPEVKQKILTIISDDEVSWFMQADNPAARKVTLQQISHNSLKQVIKEAFLAFNTSTAEQ